MGYQSKTLQSHAGAHLLLLFGASTAVLAIIVSGLWLSLSRLTGVSSNGSHVVFVVAAGILSLLALVTAARQSRAVRVLAVCALSVLTVWLVGQSAEPIFLWIVGMLLFVQVCDGWLALRLQPHTRTVGPAAGSQGIVGQDNGSHDTAGQDLGEAVVSEPALNHRRGNRLALLLIGGAFLVYMVIVPAVGQLFEANRKTEGFRQVLHELTFAESLRLHSVSGVVMAMFLAMGASIGSFLNVVIFRLPRRKALLWPPSSCSDCGSRIAGKDNIPILGWIRLSGKCRMCLAPLSVRYPIIESIVGGLFVLFFYRELLTGGGNLPVRDPNLYRGIVWILLYTKWDLVGIYFFHMLVLTMLLGWGMINWDRFRVPRYAAVVGGFVVLVIASASPDFNPAQIHLGLSPLNSLVSFTTSLTGGLVGLLCGLLLQFAFPMVGAFTPHLPLADQSGASEPCNSESSNHEPRHNGLSSAPSHSGLANGEVICMPVAEADRDIPSSLDLHSRPAARERYGSPATRPSATTDAAASMALVGAAFGPPAAVAIMLLVSVVALTAVLFSKRLKSKVPPVTLLIFAIAVIHLFAWRQLDALQPSWLPTASGSLATFCYGALAGSLLLVGVGGVRRLAFFSDQEEDPRRVSPAALNEGIETHSAGTSSESTHEEK